MCALGVDIKSLNGLTVTAGVFYGNRNAQPAFILYPKSRIIARLWCDYIYFYSPVSSGKNRLHKSRL